MLATHVENLYQVPWNPLWGVAPLRSSPIWDGPGATDEQYLKRLQIFCTTSLANLSIMEFSCINKTGDLIKNKNEYYKNNTRTYPGCKQKEVSFTIYVNN